MSKQFKVIVVLLSLLMVAAMPVAWGKQAPKKTPPITVKILRARPVDEVPPYQMDVFKYVEEKMNVHIIWDTPTESNFNERYNLLMASGDIPDIIINQPDGDLIKYAQIGVIVPLNKYIDKFAPNLKLWFKKRPEIKKAITSADGNIYYLPMFDELPTGNYVLAIREDWLKKLNLKKPVTINDWEMVWKAFKEKDPNGNGKADEIPFSGSGDKGGTGIFAVRSLVAAWGFPSCQSPVNIFDDFYSDPKDKGRVHYGPVEPRYKEALTWIARMYKAGYIDQEIFTTNSKILASKMAQDLVGSTRGFFGSQISAFNNTIPKQIPGYFLTGCEPLKGPDGTQIHPFLDQSPRKNIAFVVTKANKFPAESVKLVDYFYGEEGASLINFGIEGKHYTMADGKRIYTDFILRNPNGLSSKRARGTFSPSGGTWPFIFLKAQSDQVDHPVVTEIRRKYLGPFIPESKKYILPSYQFKTQDDEVRRRIMTDVKIYEDEMIIKFIMGIEPLDNWNKYVQRIKAMGIDQVIAIYEKYRKSY